MSQKEKIEDQKAVQELEEDRAKIDNIVQTYTDKQSSYCSRRLTDEEEIVAKVHAYMDKLVAGINGKGFTSWTPDHLYNSGVALTNWLYHVRVFAATHNSRSNFVYAYRKLSKAQAFRPVKAKLKQMLDQRVTNDEVNAELDQLYNVEQEFQIFEQRQSDILRALADSLGWHLTWINSRLADSRSESKNYNRTNLN